jgi:hypothetical protein
MYEMPREKVVEEKVERNRRKWMDDRRNDEIRKETMEHRGVSEKE